MSTRIARVLVWSALLWSAMAATASAATVVWRKTPITVELIVGVEQLVVLPEDGAIGLPPELGNPDVFRTLVTGGTAYWMALEAFEPTRIKVRLDNGEYLLFDVSARIEKAPPAQAEPLQVVLSEAADTAGQGVANDGPDGQAAVTLFELIRYAAQDLYAPARLVAPVPGVRPIPVALTGNMTALYDQGAHRGLILQPHKAWAVGGLYVTAFIVTNEHSHPMILDNRKIRHATHNERNGVAPHFVASSFFDTQLAPRGMPGNQTTLFIVTDQPIRAVLRGRL
ncbi:MAG: TIGR03749 family integrating conjugative element protein [Halioglobus sp.]|nr:TIGR03749 family integrating conjugative element protein [Halioglobus sp.]